MAAPTQQDSVPPEIEVVGRFEGRGEPIAGVPVAEWLLGDARRLSSPSALFDEFCWRLVGRDIPLWRATVSIATLDPRGTRLWLSLAPRAGPDRGVPRPP